MRTHAKLSAEEREYLTVHEVMATLDVARPLVEEWLDSGVLPHYRLGPRTLRIARADLDLFMAARRQPAPPPEPALEPALATPRSAARHEKYMFSSPDGEENASGGAAA